MLLPNNLCKWFPGICTLVSREDTPSPLLVSYPTDSLPQLTRQYLVMIALGYHLILLLSSAVSSSLPGCPFRLIVSYQACVETHLPELHPPGDSGSDLSRPTDTQRLCEDNVNKDEGSLGVPGPTKYPPPLCSKVVAYQLANYAASW